MIRIQGIHIEEFRGIRSLDLTLDKVNFGICGPNGTGKSGVVDAIEFCLTGDVTRLSGQGSGDLNVKSHAPHVDQNKNPEKASVTITAEIPSLKKTVTIKRSVKNPKKVDISPNDDAVKTIIQDLQSHPEFALSRREITKYIVTPPGQRSVDVQTLLRLEHLEKLRKSFTTFNNNASRETETAERARKTAEADFRSGLKLQELDRAAVLEKINEQRKILGLEPITELKKDTAFKEGVPAEAEKKEQQKLSKTTASNDIATFQQSSKAPEPEDLINHKTSAKEILEKLDADKNLLSLSRQLKVVEQIFPEGFYPLFILQLE